VSKGTIELGEFDFRQGGHKVSELTLENQCKKIAADGGGPWQTIFHSQHDLRCQSKNFSINGGADHRRHIFMLSEKGPRYNHVKSRLSATLCESFACAVDLPAPHERACSEMSTRAWRARRLRCLRNTSPSFASVARRRSRSAYWRSAVRTSAARFLYRGEVSVSSSRSFRVASSIAIVFIRRIITAVLDCAQGLRSVVLARADKVIR
jgi:hypothetical protein